MSLSISRESILKTVEKIRIFSRGLTALDVPYVDRDLVNSHLNQLKAMRSKFIEIQDQIVAAARGGLEEQEEAFKSSTLIAIDALCGSLSQLLTHYPAPSDVEEDNATADLTPVDKLCLIMQNMMKQNEKLYAKLTEQASTTPLDSRSIRLPQIDLPKFSGKYCDWVPFKDRFRSCIASLPSLSKVQKLEYLKSCLSGDAASTIGYLPTTEANFDVAWELLKNRFERKSEIIAEHIRTFYNMPSVTPSDPNAIQRILNIVSESLLALDAISATGRDPWLIQYTLDKLDAESRVLWGRQCATMSEEPTMRMFRTFLNQRCIDATHASPAQSNPNPRSQPRNKKSGKQGNQTNAFHGTAAAMCQCCNQSSHPLYKCPKFLGQNAGERFETVQKLSLCRNCLCSHSTNTCTFRRCKKCKGVHNVLLHDKFVGDAAAPPLASNNPPQSTNSAPSGSQQVTNSGAPASVPSANVHVASAVYECTVPTGPRVFLATAMVDVLTAKGDSIPCRVLLDSGAQICIMTTNLYQKLNLPKIPSDIAIVGIGNQKNVVKHRVVLTIHSQKSDESFSFNCYVIPKISGNLPNWKVDTKVIKPPSNLPLADPNWDVSRPVDLLISGDPYWASWLTNICTLGTGLPHLRETTFGYVVVGEHQRPPQVRYVHHAEATALDEVLKRFLEVEELPEDVPLTDQQSEAEAHFSRTYHRDGEGRFVVKLPFREKPTLLGDSRPQAVRQFLALERQFEKKPQFKALYVEVMKDYLDRKWLEPVPREEFDAPSYYMPHHGVMKESSSTTKLRVVYNASAKSSSGYSLNDLLLVGPTVQPDLSVILLIFRLFMYAMTADLSKMYLQLKMDPEDSNFQRLVWRNSRDEPIRDYRIPRVCFGVASSPFLATRALIQLSDDYKSEFPLASDALRSNFYVDDCIVSIQSISQAKQLQEQLMEVLKRGGFVLTKWTSNNRNLYPDDDETAGVFSMETQTISALGLTWDSIQDRFLFQSPVDASVEIKSKRNLASAIAKLFDPLGLIGPVVVEAKIMLQKLHQLKLGWDEKVPAEILHQWKSFVKELQHIQNISIPRWISIFQQPARTELHVFCDASSRAYGTAIYIVTSYDGAYHSSLYMSKSRVAPLKQRTIPQLELSAALVGADTFDKYKEAFQPDAVFYWSDATTVLYWINSPPDAYKVFVANRIRRIRDLTGTEQWRHVSTDVNPADLVSRGASPSDLENNTLWWKGPNWLERPETHWPAPFNPSGQPQDRDALCFLTTTDDDDESHIFKRLRTKHSSLPKIQRIVAYCLRFLNKNPDREYPPGGPIRAEEMEKALLSLVRYDQRISYPDLYSELENMQPLSHKCKSFKSLAPFMDKDALIRVGGRLENADIPFAAKHPVLLPQTQLSLMIISFEHVRQLHAPETLLYATVRQRFWPTGGKNMAKRVVHECLKCFRANPKPLEQLMGNLPESRVTYDKPFHRTGVDFAGPIQMISAATRGVRSRKAGTQKVYIAVFVCMATKMAHLELVPDLSTEAFIAALRCLPRAPRHMYSDCGKNFQGAANELQKLFNEETAQMEIVNGTQSDGIQWHFNPPASPHHGGLWEACVKSMKYHLLRATGGFPMTYGEFHLILRQITRVLNSRPICMLSTDPNEESYLTPGHFGFGEASNSLPDPDVTHIPESRQSHYQLCQARTQIFAKSWRRQYLNTLQQIRRWQNLRKNLKQGDIVLLYDDTSREHTKWLLGKIEATHPGSDGLVRVVSVRTPKGIYKRTITKIACLPISDNEESGHDTSLDTSSQTGENVHDSI